MADNSSELPHRPRGASFNSFPPCLPSYLRSGSAREKTSEVPDTSPTGSTGDNEETKKVRFLTDISSGHHKRPLGSETEKTSG